jgi:hypothetical protein
VRAHQRFPLAAAGLPAISTTNLSPQCISNVTRVTPHFGRPAVPGQVLRAAAD